MAKFNHDKYRKQLFLRTEGYAAGVQQIYRDYISQIVDLIDTSEIDTSKAFQFSDYSDIEAKANDLLREMYNQLYSYIRTSCAEEWKEANLKNDELVQAVFGKKAMDKNHLAKYFQHNAEARDAFINRADAGMNLSKRVWNLTSQFKQELELSLDLGIGEGKSAATLSKSIRKYLDAPDKLFRRVRDKHGDLQLSKNAKAYHPGQGVYRSSHKNAMRLIRTETNMAYREADYSRWNQMDFVIGIEIKCSNNHPVKDICDDLAGKYPKDFKFSGWHPQCRCYAIPILASEEDFIERQSYILEGKEEEAPEFEGEIRDVPPEFKQWIRDNRERIDSAASVPYWIRDNREYVDAEDGALRLVKEKNDFWMSNGTSTPDSSHARDVNIYTNTQGVEFIIPKDIRRGYQSITIEQLGKQFNELPVWLQETVKQVQLVDYRNPQDKYWEKTYKIKSFTSFATGGNGTITFYKNDRKVTDRRLLEVLAHESGHNLDREVGRVSNTKKWKDAATKDYKVSGKQYVSAYATAAKSYIEDFADSISGYCTDVDYFKKTYPNRSKIIEEIVRNREKQKSR